MNWPFMLRSTHERLMEAAEEAHGRSIIKVFNDHTAAENGRRCAEGRAQIAAVRADVAEAQLHQLAAPLVEVMKRAAALTIAVRAPAPGESSTKVIVCLTIHDAVLPVFRDHSRALGYATAELVQGAMVLMRSEEARAAADTGQESRPEDKQS